MPGVRRAVLLVAVALLMSNATLARAGSDPVPASLAAQHVGTEATVEGRIVATHTSPLATVLGFAPNYAGFTATILTADRAKFPSDIDQRCRGKLVRVTGLVTAYRGKPEMTLREPSQLLVVPAPNQTPIPLEAIAAEPSPAVPTPDRAVQEIAQGMALISQRLSAMEARVTALERALAAGQTVASEQAPSLTVGETPDVVRGALGNPVAIDRGREGGTVWRYDDGHSVTFDRGGRVLGWTGF
jgi:hypothetical protein